MCVGAQPQPPVPPEQLLREMLCGPQEHGCAKGSVRLSGLASLGRVGKQGAGDHQGTFGTATSLTRDTQTGVASEAWTLLL